MFVNKSVQKAKTLEYFGKIEDQLNTLWNNLDTRDVESFGVKPTTDTWSILQILEHLRQSEELSLKYIKYKIDNNARFRKTGFSESLKIKTLVRAFKSERKFKAPDVNGLSPQNEGLSYDEIKQKYTDIRSDFKSYLSGLDDSYFILNVYKHPIIGRINLLQMLKFFEVHVSRHRKQIERAL